ncbi:Putative methyltransferase, LIC12133 family [Methylophilaceae bacterium]
MNKFSIKRIAKFFAPVWFVKWYCQIGGLTIRFVGTYPNWQAAEKEAIGYDADEILQKVIEKTRLVVSGEVAYERDGIAFDEPVYCYPLIALLLRVTTENNNKLTVLDFGGSLGSTYYQCRSFLQGVSVLKWGVVEQSHFVEAGKMHFANEILSFHNSFDDFSAKFQPNVVILSGVLQCLSEPFVVLEKAIIGEADYIVIDRTPFIDEGDTVLTLQKVPKHIVDSSYPVWLFNEVEFKNVFFGKFSEIATFDAIDSTIGYGRLKANFKGIMFKRIKEK